MNINVFKKTIKKEFYFAKSAQNLAELWQRNIELPGDHRRPNGQMVDSRILILGITFMEGCPDLSNIKVIDIVREPTSYHAQIDIYDPWIDVAEAEQEYQVSPLKDKPERGIFFTTSNPCLPGWSPTGGCND